MPFTSHEEYIALQPKALRGRLEQIQQEVERQVPDCTRAISYDLPAFKQKRTFFYFASFKKHIGVYPPVTQDLGLIEETEALRGPKGNLSFPHDTELPLALIGRIARALATQYGGDSKANPSTPARTKKPAQRPSKRAAPVESVDDYLEALQHPHKKGVQALRKVILSIDARIKEEVKWNAPSFRLDDHFATFRLNPCHVFQLILHTGAKVKASPKQFAFDDPHGLAKWAAKDRCTLTFESDADASSKRASVKKIVQAWISQL